MLVRSGDRQFPDRRAGVYPPQPDRDVVVVLRVSVYVDDDVIIGLVNVVCAADELGSEAALTVLLAVLANVAYCTEQGWVDLG